MVRTKIINKAMLSALIGMVFLLCGCEEESPYSTEEEKNKVTAIQFKNIGNGSVEYESIGGGMLFGNGKENIKDTCLVIHDSTEWNNLINAMNSANPQNDYSENFQKVNVDFSKKMLIAVFLEVKRSGWEVKVKNISEYSNHVEVVTEEKTFINSVITQPFHIVEVEIIDKPIELKQD